MLLDGSTVWEAPEAIMKISDVLSRLIGARDPNCPNEADVLAYSENKLSNRDRGRVERHFAECDDCRQVLAFLGRESEEASAPFTENAVQLEKRRGQGNLPLNSACGMSATEPNRREKLEPQPGSTSLIPNSRQSAF